MKTILLCSLLCAVACGGNQENSLTGSLSEVYPLNFDTVEAQVVDQYLIISYVRAPSGTSAGGKTIKLTVDTTGITLAAAQEINLTEMVGNGMRGTMQQIIGSSVDLPLKVGTLDIDQVPMDGQTFSGHFAAQTSNPNGRTVSGNFKTTVKKL